MTVPLLEVQTLTRRFGGLTAVHDVTFSVDPREITAIIGPNGAGKTTLFNMITGLLQPTSGEVRFQGTRLTGLQGSRIAALGVIRTFQNLAVFADTTAVENVMVGCHRWTCTGFLQAAFALPAAIREDRQAHESALEALALVGLRARAHERARALPLGQQRLVEIARALASRPTVLLLDEPTAGLSAGEAHHLLEVIRRLRAESVTFAIIEHNMDIVMEAADRVIVLDYGEKIAEGTPQEIQRNPRVIAAYLGDEVGEGAAAVPGGGGSDAVRSRAP